MPRPAIAVMAKAPRPGLAKTRLIPALGAEGAAALAHAFLIDTAALARAAAAQAGGDAYVIATPDAACDELAALTGLPALPQGQGDLGARMTAAFAALFAREHSPVLLLGADTPALPPNHIATALTLAATAPTFGPTGDGGYWTVGLPALAPALFEAIAWGGPTVLAETRDAAVRAGLTLAFAPPWDDVDEPADLDVLRRQLAAAPEAARATRAALAQLAPGS
jgi:rSAM/selenodomain-associated transferase 1